MKEIIEKLSSYNVLNYLVPGALFAILGEQITAYTFARSDVVTGLILYYFIGLVISRLGSLLIEPALKKLKFIKFAAYPDYVAASATDAKIDTLSEANNTYRTLCTLFLSLGLLKVYELLANRLTWTPVKALGVFCGVLFLLFLFSYRKQTNYISQRVKTVNEQTGKEKNRDELPKNG
ncbi:MAG: hypothetical protein R3E01_36465 [Pirellulaceae bacterium]